MQPDRRFNLATARTIPRSNSVQDIPSVTGAQHDALQVNQGTRALWRAAEGTLPYQSQSLPGVGSEISGSSG